MADPVAIYALSSSDRDLKRNKSIVKLRTYCHAHGWMDATEYIETPCTTSGVDQTKLQHLLSDVHEGRVQTVVVQSTDPSPEPPISFRKS